MESTTYDEAHCDLQQLILSRQTFDANFNSTKRKLELTKTQTLIPQKANNPDFEVHKRHFSQNLCVVDGRCHEAAERETTGVLGWNNFVSVLLTVEVS